MSSERQIEANRLNAQKSTGPTTPEGRAAVRLNGIKHGLSAATIVVPGEDPAEFDALLDAFQAEYEPTTPTEEFLVRQIAMADWRLLRLHRVVAGFFNLQHEMLLDPSNTFEDLDAATRLGFIAKLDINPQGVLATLHRFEVHFVRSAKDALKQLLHYREHRRANQTQSEPAQQPKRDSSPKIININTAQNSPAPVAPNPEPLPSAPPDVSPPPTAE